MSILNTNKTVTSIHTTRVLSFPQAPGSESGRGFDSLPRKTLPLRHIKSNFIYLQTRTASNLVLN